MSSHLVGLLAGTLLALVTAGGCAQKDYAHLDPALVEKEVALALEQLYAESAAAAEAAPRAKGILLFPKVDTVTMAAGARFGNGLLLVDGRVAGYYRLSAILYGVTIGNQTFGYALLLMSDEALQRFRSGSSWELGLGIAPVFGDAGLAVELRPAAAELRAFAFGQTGLALDLGHLQGVKITKTAPAGPR